MKAHDNDGAVTDLGNGNFAYLQAGGSWGWSNAGLITSEGESLLVDTLFDLPLTRKMLERLRRVSPAADQIDTLVNTHSDGDHTHGNELLASSRIIASYAAKQAMASGVQPRDFAEMLTKTDQLGDLGRFLSDNFGDFDFASTSVHLPTTTFSGEMLVNVGSKEVQLIEVGPTHTPGDVVVYVPKDRVVYTGDILFNGSHPIVWTGPVSRWINACDLITSWDVESVVPGHGPLADLGAIAELKEYFLYLVDLGTAAYHRGLSPRQAAHEVAWRNRWADWGEAERLVVTFASIYEELGAPATFERPIDGLKAMAGFAYHHDQARRDAGP